jgi:hypothetical protein
MQTWCGPNMIGTSWNISLYPIDNKARVTRHRIPPHPRVNWTYHNHMPNRPPPSLSLTVILSATLIMFLAKGRSWNPNEKWRQG